MYNIPNGTKFKGVDDIENDYIDMHLEAGLLYSGEDDEGNIEWLGEPANWQRLEELEKEYERDIEEFKNKRI